MYVPDDDEPRAYAPSGSERGQWLRVAEALPAEFARLELVNREGAIVWALDAPEEVSTAAPGATTKAPASGSPEAMLAMMLRAQDVALARQGETVAKLTASYESLARTLTERLSALESLVSAVLQTAYEAVISRAEVEAQLVMAQAGADGDKPSGAMKLAERLLGAKFGIVPVVPPKPNGAPKATARAAPKEPAGAGAEPQ